jgi:hypothetical protein
VIEIRLDDTTDWGCQGSDEDRANYEEAVASAIAEAFPGADVTVQCLQRAGRRVVVTTRDEDGRILVDHATCREESLVESSVLEIADAVWDAGEFWTEVQS